MLGLCSTAKYPIESRNKRIKPILITDYSASRQRRFKMVQNKSAKRAGHYRHYGVTFQNGAKPTLGMLDPVTYRYGTDLEPTGRTTPYFDLSRLEQGTGVRDLTDANVCAQ